MNVGHRLFEDWTAMWNGELSLADRILAPGFRVWFGNTLGGADTDACRGPGFVRFVAAHREARPGIRYVLEGDPIGGVEAGPAGGTDSGGTGRVACRWYATRPGATTVSGIDILAFSDGRIEQAWSLSGDRAFATVELRESVTP
ncbi:ester cyclase [Streptomyces sp. LX-29]|uniref:hypothetical protein n=1 Tax=Streptomyces sp. LX-29 TaxID=2900152 RepID=UPI00240E215D|nr:hypothetical protein [Streptomyces sp. LX-29]WFB08178.1 ester cyclase [Streptomyces sp. LX-29]